MTIIVYNHVFSWPCLFMTMCLHDHLRAWLFMFITMNVHVHEHSRTFTYMNSHVRSRKWTVLFCFDSNRNETNLKRNKAKQSETKQITKRNYDTLPYVSLQFQMKRNNWCKTKRNETNYEAKLCKIIVSFVYFELKRNNRCKTKRNKRNFFKNFFGETSKTHAKPM